MQSYGPPKLQESHLCEFWDSHLGVPGPNDIWVLVLWLGIKYTIKGQGVCRNPSLGLATKARACKVAGQEKKLESEKKCEGMSFHTPKGASTLGVGVLVDS